MIDEKRYKHIQARELEWWTHYNYNPAPSLKQYNDHFGPYLKEFGVISDIGCGPVPYIFSPLVAYEAAWVIDPLIHEYLKIPKYADVWKGKQVCSAISTIFLSENYLDAAFALNVLDHVQDPTFMLLEIARVLAPGGRLFLMVDIDKPPDPMHPHKIDGKWLLEWLVERFDVLMFKTEKSWKFANDIFWFVGNLKDPGGKG